MATGSFVADARARSRSRILPISYLHLAGALLCGLALRVFFVARFPFYAGDTKFYEELARNWLDHRVYGLFVRGDLMPVDLRVPGYPAFLAAVYSILGRTRMAVMLVQAAIDLLTCVLAALIAAAIVPQRAPADRRSQAATIALWIAALCPFTASYTAAVLTETLATFFTTLALLVLVRAVTDSSLEGALGQSGDGTGDRLSDGSGDGSDARSYDQAREGFSRTSVRILSITFLLAGAIAGLGTLVRPETPLVLAAGGIVICIRWRRQADWRKLALAGLWMAVGLIAVLAPWAARNARTMGRVDFLAPHYAESAGDYIPRGFHAWTRTWMVRYGDAYTVTWALGKKPIELDVLPGGAFDSDAERARVAELLASYNSDLKMTPSLDRKFEALARERSAAHPVRSLVMIPVKRALAIWFAPRVDVLRYSGKLWPPGEQRRAKPEEFDVTVIFALLDFAYIALGIVGAWRYRMSAGCALVVLYLVIRTTLLTQLATVEPRYVVVCFPAVAALCALAFVKSKSDSSRATRETSVATSAA
jgi:4-amino-4-deoxy-L-arabinose transferase-like glycosyltransferase